MLKADWTKMERVLFVIIIEKYLSEVSKVFRSYHFRQIGFQHSSQISLFVEYQISQRYHKNTLSKFQLSEMLILVC